MSIAEKIRQDLYKTDDKFTINEDKPSINLSGGKGQTIAGSAHVPLNNNGTSINGNGIHSFSHGCGDYKISINQDLGKGFNTFGGIGGGGEKFGGIGFSKKL